MKKKLLVFAIIIICFPNLNAAEKPALRPRKTNMPVLAQDTTSTNAPPLPQRKRNIPILETQENLSAIDVSCLPIKENISVPEIQRKIILLEYKKPKPIIEWLDCPNYLEGTLHHIPCSSSFLGLYSSNQEKIIKKYVLSEKKSSTQVTLTKNDLHSHCLFISSDGTQYAHGCGKNITFYQTNPMTILQDGFESADSHGHIERIAFDLNNKRVITYHPASHYFRITDIQGNQMSEFKQSQQQNIYFLAFSPNGEQFIAISKHGFMLYNCTQNITAHYTRKIETSHINKIEYDKMGWFLSGYNSTLSTWYCHNLQGISQITQIGLYSTPSNSSDQHTPSTYSDSHLYAYDRSPCGDYIFVEDIDHAGIINIFHLPTQTCINKIDTQESKILSISCGIAGKIIILSKTKTNALDLNVHDIITEKTHAALNDVVNIDQEQNNYVSFLLDRLLDSSEQVKLKNDFKFCQLPDNLKNYFANYVNFSTENDWVFMQ